MYAREALTDLHDRAHRSLRRLVAHCGGLSPEALDRELYGFGYPSVRLQLHHVIGAEEYWIGVLQGKMLVDDDPASYPTATDLEGYRARVFETTRDYLNATSDTELNAAREMVTWQGKRRLLVPALVVLRPVVHAYHHQGQVMAMLRLLGSPGPEGVDLPID